MKRLLIVFVVLLAGLAASAHFKIRSSVTDGLESIKASAAPFATISYGDVSTTLDGNIQIDNLRVTPRVTGEPISAEQVSVVTGGAWALLNLKNRLESGELPERLAFAVKGLNVDFLYDLMEQSAEQNEIEVFESAGCGDRSRLSRQDLASMGYQDMLVDLDFGYQLSSTGNEITFSNATTTRNHSRFTVDVLLSSSTPFTDTGPSPIAFQQSRLESATVTLTDLGHVERTKTFCADVMDISEEAFQSRHLQAWQAAWRQFGLEPSETLLETYGDYYANSSSTLTLEIEPYPALSMSDNYLSPDPEYLSERLNPKLGTDRTGLKDIGFAKATQGSAPPNPAPVAKEMESEQPSAVKSPDVSSSESDSPEFIQVSELANNLRKDVTIVLTDGQMSQGRIEGVEDGKLKLKLRMYGGSMVIPVPLDRIRSVQRQ